MKIGILTLSPACNYGGILQAYALQRALTKQGHDVSLIDFPKEWKLSLFKRILLYTKRFILKYAFRKPIVVKIDQKHNSELREITKYTSTFIKKYITRTIINDFSELRANQFDTLIVGSDQIWRPKYYCKNIENAFFCFAQNWNINRISYAASFGTDKWEYTPEQTAHCSKLIQLFNAVSVREKTGIELCKKYLSTDATQVLDPTLLLDRNEYIRLFSTEQVPQSPGNMFCYILDKTSEKNKVISMLSEKHKLIPFEVNAKYDDTTAKLEDRIQPKVEQWLRGFYDAELIFTDSFHACVFSIIFNKPFIVIGNKERGMTRFHSLLELFNLNDRFISSIEDLNILHAENINWTSVNEKLERYKEKSLNFLKSNIHDHA